MIIVYSYYVLDIVHKGHLEMLRNAKAMAGPDGRLIVGILTEAACCEKKPPPVMSFEERVELARSIECVDLVVTQDTYSPLNNIMAVKPDILMESSSHVPEDDVEAAMKELGGRIVRVPYFPEHSSTNIKKEIVNGQKTDCSGCGGTDDDVGMPVRHVDNGVAGHSPRR